MEIVPSNIEGMFAGYQTTWQAAFDEAKPWASKISSEMPSSSEREVYAFRDQVPRMTRWVGERIVDRIGAHGYQITNEDWQMAIGVPRNKIEDDGYGIFSLDFRAQGSAAAKWPDDMVAEALLAAEALVCFDGQCYFDTDHPVDVYDSSKGTFSNLKTSRALTAANYALSRREMRLFKNNNGRYAGIVPDLLVIPPQKEDLAKTILQTDLIARSSLEGETQVGAVNNIYKNTADYLVIEELGDYPDEWYLMCTTRAIKPFMHQIRKAPQFQAYFNPSDPNLFFFKEYLFGCDARGAAGVTLPILAMKCKA